MSCFARVHFRYLIRFLFLSLAIFWRGYLRMFTIIMAVNIFGSHVYDSVCSMHTLHLLA